MRSRPNYFAHQLKKALKVNKRRESRDRPNEQMNFSGSFSNLVKGNLEHSA